MKLRSERRESGARLVLADAEFDSEPNHQHIRQRLGAKSIADIDAALAYAAELAREGTVDLPLETTA